MKNEALWYYEFNESEEWMGWRDEVVCFHDWQVMTKKEFEKYCQVSLSKKRDIWNVKRRKASKAEAALRKTTEYKKRLENYLNGTY